MKGTEQVTDFNNKPFGIFEVEVTAPDNINIPILQLRVKTQAGGTRTIAPIIERGFIFQRKSIMQ